MLIHRMTASFGKLQGESLELKSGLNILQAPNETGKSTWCAFLLSMFYGINSRERDRTGFIADKNRYAPWNGAAMSGRLDCRIGDTDVTLTRTTRRQTSPMSDFQAVYSGTANTFPNLNGQNCGENLLGVTREVYERSAFIRQASLAITQDAGLERRISSLITTGEEGSSYSESIELLKKQLNRRRHNKTGQIPTLEAELLSLRHQLEEVTHLESQLQNSRSQTEQFLSREASLSAELKIYENWEAQQKRRTLEDAARLMQQSQQRADTLRHQIEESHIPENETIGRLRGALVNLETTRKAVEKAQAKRDDAAKVLLRAEAAASASPFAGQTPEEVRREIAEPPSPKVNPVPSILAGLAVLAIVAVAVYVLLWQHPMAIPAGIPFGAAVTAALSRRAKKKAQTAALTKRFGTADQTEISALADTYYKLYDALETAQADLNAASATVNTLRTSLSSNEQAILLEVRRFAPTAFDSAAADALLRECGQRRKALSEADATAKECRMRYDLLAQQTPPTSENVTEISVPERSKEAILEDLEQTRAELRISRSAVDRLTGQLHAIGDPAVLQSTAAHLQEEIQKLESEYVSIRMAMDALEHANTTLQNRFSPELGRRAAEIFSELTNDQYHGVVLDRAFHLSAEPTGDTVYRDAQLLSAGTIDQLYLATRLAICELVLPADPSVPIVLDDALSNFDDPRCFTALRWLKEAAKKRQILLFTCHSREVDYFSNDPEVSIQRLTNHASQV